MCGVAGAPEQHWQEGSDKHEEIPPVGGGQGQHETHLAACAGMGNCSVRPPGLHPGGLSLCCICHGL